MMKNPYLLLTPGPLSTTASVRETMLKDWCTWDDEYNNLVQDIRKRLVKLATASSLYTAVLMQGSGTFCVEAAIGTFVPRVEGKILIAANGAYGLRMVHMCEAIGINNTVYKVKETESFDTDVIERMLQEDEDITHVAVVHCETTTGILNPIEEVCCIAKRYNKMTIVDAMSSFGGIPMDIEQLQIDLLISSSNKCIQGVPGFGFVIAKTDELEKCKGNARSLSLDLYDQYKTMEKDKGKWRFTSPTHVVRAFYQALLELEEEGGVQGRFKRYRENQHLLVTGMRRLGFNTLLQSKQQSPIITSFLYPTYSFFTFQGFYQSLKKQGFVIYPGKVSQVDTFRIGNIGDVHKQDIERLLEAIHSTVKRKEIQQ
ncbi:MULTISPECIES: 2-aminoethylphosphonate--pyruvate transaminase [Priestia]|uniref:2-aminoethylphosphonate--pyruvate transaminase n=1 Tax=Priestia megaterium TaxID=1404 RepID=A0ABD4WWA1_PRIMG|nr:2-aminoethylphosphonate--pyruvate transaminase [Priestia megaterium]KRF56625.1 2-aminoethylphosphonate--pyruvate aminotransferase [Bacillus sp. Soil531]MCF6797117.1 2-aminoethylphosphonate--pyruvate transaminase [Bacillus sp. ET1]MDD9784516.1 2-aminoethylphosphonate--pyruvate transaminase [Priestia megaterium]MED3813955.1 2-aminoethylphosphonate--pyruvate transaminase [Priestia megaterium]MED3827305.1 2-aminoethylphosphonate--pyruvate transaminase [Priestia megaterium]